VQLGISEQAGRIIAGLAAAYRTDPGLLPEGWRGRLPAAEPERMRHIGDFIAGMTDRYAIARYREAIGPVEISEGF
jgi:dGTPase